MLCLSRKVSQSLKIGEAVVHIRRLHGGRVYLAIDAPKDVKILRVEVKDKGKAA